MSPQPKVCAECGATFCRPKDYSHAMWQARKYCGRPCLYLAQKRRPKKARDVEVLRVEFMALVEKTDTCWLWKGSAPPGFEGYGCFSMGRAERAHRAAHLLFIGPIPKGMLVCHECDTPLCVRLEHLFLGTHADNNRDRAKKGRSADTRGHRSPLAKLTAEQAQQIRELYDGARHTTVSLARDFGSNQCTVWKIVKGLSYAA